MPNKVLEAGDNIKWIYYHLDNFISCNLHPLKKRRAKACIIELHKDDNMIKLSDGYFTVYAHLNNKVFRSISSSESLDYKKCIYPVVSINNFHFQIKLSKNFKKYDSELNKTKYIIMLETPEIELTGESCKLKNKGNDVMKLNSVVELLENGYEKNEKKYNNYYKNIYEEKIADSQESTASNIPLSNPSVSQSSKEMEEGEENDGDDEEEEEESKEEKEEKENEENEEESEEPLTQISPVRKKKTKVSKTKTKSPSPDKIINENITTEIQSIHTLPSSIISTHSSIWITNKNNSNKSNINLTPSASYTVLSMLDEDNSNKTNNKNNKSGNDEDNNERTINIDDILPRGPDIERNKRSEGKNMNKNKSNKINNNNKANNKEKEKEVEKGEEKENENGFKFMNNKVIDVIFENKKLQKQYTCMINLNGHAEKRKIEEIENVMELFRDNYMRKMKRLVESRNK